MRSGPRVVFNGLSSCIHAGSLGLQLACKLDYELRLSCGDRLFFEHGTASMRSLHSEFWLRALRYRGEL